jgi:hypothetical protein
VSDNLEAFCGDTLQISHIFDPEIAVTISAVECAIIDVEDPDGVPLVAAGVGDSEAYSGRNVDASALAERVWYNWATPDTGVEARYYLSFTYTPTGGTALIKTFAGSVELWPRGSYLDRYLVFIQDLLQESELGERQAELGLRDYRRALTLALASYNELLVDVLAAPATLTHLADTLTAGHFASVCWVAAAIALLGPQAVAYLRTSTPEIAAQFVNRDPRANTAVFIAREWLRMAKALWSSYAGADGLQTGSLSISDVSPWEVERTDIATWAGV